MLKEMKIKDGSIAPKEFANFFFTSALQLQMIQNDWENALFFLSFLLCQWNFLFFLTRIGCVYVHVYT